MGFYRLSIDVDIQAANIEQAHTRLLLLIGDLESSGRPWITEVLPDATEERMPLSASA